MRIDTAGAEGGRFAALSILCADSPSFSEFAVYYRYDWRGCNSSASTYINATGQKQDIYSSTEEAVLVKRYFYMEYNRLLKKDRLDVLFDPPQG